MRSSQKRLGPTGLAGRLLLLVAIVATFVLVGSAVALANSKSDGGGTKPWSFGVMSDTQWTLATDPANANPNNVAVSIAKQLNKQFIAKGVEFVIQVGDLTENGNDADIAVRAAAAEELYKRGIGFFPMRGNHETYASPANGYGISAFLSNFPQTRGKSNTFGAKAFSSPVLAGGFPNDLKGLSYSFDFGSRGNDARFVIIDDWATPNQRFDAAGYPYGYLISEQQPWITSRLDEDTRGTEHAFVFSHQNIMGQNHQDSIFGGYTNANPDMQNAFFASLEDNGVRYYTSGHDHIHQRSLVASPDGNSTIEELICASNSSKFYTPRALDHPNWFGQKVRETSLSQELYTVGYYIFTIDGPRVTVDYYADDHGNWKSDAEYPNGSGSPDVGVTPTFHFAKKATWGYSTNGEQFLVGGANDPSYTVVQDTFKGTSAKILSGTYSNLATDYNARVLAQTVDTGWTVDSKSDKLNSNILTLWGMANVGTGGKTDEYVLSMSYEKWRNASYDQWCKLSQGKGHNPSYGKGRNAGPSGGFGFLVTQDAKGRWVNAVDKNFGGAKKFVVGPWQAGYGLGTYGVDPATRTAWAVLNYNASFAVSE